MKKAGMTFLKFLLFFIGWAVLSSVIEIPGSDPSVWRFFAELVPFAIMVILSIVFLRIEKGGVKIPITKNIGKGTALGIVIGAIWIGASAVILLASRHLVIVEKNDVTNLWLWIIAAFINVIMQELLVRGYLYQLLKTKYNILLSVIITTALFTFLHGGAFEAGVIPVINVITMCLFTTALYEAEGTILAPVMAHSIWNIVGAIIIGGVSLADDYPSLYSTVASGNVLLSGGNYKIEASIIVTIINIALMLIFFFKYKICNKRNR